MMVEHDTEVVDDNGEKADPVKALLVTAPNIRAARRKLTEQTHFHIRRFLTWKELPLYPADEEAVALPPTILPHAQRLQALACGRSSFSPGRSLI